MTKRLGRRDYRIAYQSQVTGTPVPWLQPDVNDVIQQVREDGFRDVIVAPIGFLCDHMEVLYDLDVQAKETAEACELGYVRSGTVSNHPAFRGHAQRSDQRASGTCVRRGMEQAANRKRAVVIGGGLTGLTVCYRLMQQAQAGDLPLDVVLLEAGDRLGGVIATRHEACPAPRSGDGLVLEEGPDCFLTTKPEGCRVV